jgi:hypothetical protein
VRILLFVEISMIATICAASAQQADAGAIKKLEFLRGTWTCTVQNGPANIPVQESNYSFSPDGMWMTETSHDTGSSNDWETQVWGYDTKTKKLVAYQFVDEGVFTKTVDGWIDGAFTSHRDDNGASVTVRPTAGGSAQWVIASADHSYIVKQNCVRRT